jgi:hypothetical protein
LARCAGVSSRRAAGDDGDDVACPNAPRSQPLMPPLEEAAGDGG